MCKDAFVEVCANRDFLKEVSLQGDLVESSKPDDVSVSYDVTHSFADKNTNVEIRFESRCISVCMAANDLNFPDGVGFRTPVRIDGVVEYLVRLSPIVRFVSAPRDRAGCHSLIPVDHDTFRVPPLARIKLERIDEPGEWSVNDHAIWQRCYTVSLSYG